MPRLAAFVATHHVEEHFVKRQRSRKSESEELFGQEPIFVRRQRQASRDSGDDGSGASGTGNGGVH